MNTLGRQNFDFSESLIFERGSEGRTGVDLPEGLSFTEAQCQALLGEEYRQSDALQLPQCSEPEVCRHYTRLSRWNFSIDTGSYPLGSCTMKYNPKINEWAGRLPGFAALHPYTPTKDIQGALAIMWDLQQWLCEIAGFEGVTLQPSAGAHGEFVGVLMIHEALKARGEKRKKMLVPESAHGTNPATAAFLGYAIETIAADADGTVSLEEVARKMDKDTAGIMVTNPNTLGIFEKNISQICHIVHDNGGFVYGDGANLNALLGIARPGDFGIDVMHFNLHKTFTTPHGGGGPGCGAVGASAALSAFLPTPLVKQTPHGYDWDTDRPQSIGRVRSFYGNFGMMVRAWTYIREMGQQGLKEASERAVLNANYVRAKLKEAYHLPITTDSLHEVVFNDRLQKERGVSTMDIAKRLIDYGVHPPTVYFPLVVSGALMIEPTETESKGELDAMCEAFLAVAKEAQENPALVQSAPHHTALRRLNEAQAARQPVLRWQKKEQ